LRSRPLVERRKLLAKLLKKAPDNIRFSEELQGTREELLQVARQFQLEGLIAKRPDSVYESGQRSGAWVKVKLTQAQESVIGGYTPAEGSRMYFGSLLVGYYDSSGLLLAGRVGTGFSEKALATLYGGLQKIRRTTCPFVNLPEKRPGHWAQGITPAVMKRCSWVEPVLVAQVKFTEWASGYLRNRLACDWQTLRCLHQLILLAMTFSSFAISAANLRMPSAVFSVAIASSFRR
jgi:bifunctional non-homologous end joining protein LigD